jgi:hypothetical protein
MSALGLLATTLQRHGKNTLKTIFDLVPPGGLILRGCALHTKGER